MSERLDAIRDRLAKATPGPWRNDEHVDFPTQDGYEVYVAPSDGGPFGTDGPVGWVYALSDAALIANAPTDLAYLLAELDNARAGLAEAWDAGWQDAHADHNDNPYRKEAP